jgi:hypothetical protein
MRVTSRRAEPKPIPKNEKFEKIREKKRSETKFLILIDQTKIRKKYVSTCKKSIKDLEKAKTELNDYHTKDIPEYEKWYNQSFGSKLSAIREAELKAQELYQLISEIEYYKDEKRITFHQAYLLVMDRKANPEKYRLEDEAREQAERDEEEKERVRTERYYENRTNQEKREDKYNNKDKKPEFDMDEILEAFEDFLDDNPKLKAQAKNRMMYSFLFAQFAEDFIKHQEQESGYKNHKKSEPEIEETEEERIKSTYRKLARKLHPDFQKEITPFMRNLWLEVQNAYADKDLEKLETLLSLTSIQSGDFSDDFSISDILNVQKEYKQQLKSIRSEIKKLKKNTIWGFSKLTNKKPLTKELENTFNATLRDFKSDINNFESMIKKYSTPPSPNEKTAQAKSNKKSIFTEADFEELFNAGFFRRAR